KDNKFVTTEAKENEAFEWLLNHIADEAIQPLDISKTLSENMVLLNNAYGYGRLKPIAQQQKILDLIDFPVRRDPTTVFLWLEKELSILNACGGKNDELFLRRVIMAALETSLNPTSVFESGDFWFSLRGTFNLSTTFKYEDVKTMICEYWEAHRNKKLPVEKDPFDPTKKAAAAYQVTKSFKKCDYCLKYRKRLSKSHNTPDCFFGDNEGWNKLQKSNLAKESGESENENSNKGDSSYSSLCMSVSPVYYDTGCTPTSYFKDKPMNLKHYDGSVKTASNQKVNAKGIGEIKLGKITIDNVIWVPSFEHNLLSGIQLMNMGYDQAITQRKLKVTKDNEICLKGTYNPSVGLIEIDHSYLNLYTSGINKIHDVNHWHKRLSHFSARLIKRNLDLKNIKYLESEIHCESCLQAKAKRKSIRHKIPKSITNYQPLEMIEADTTVFPIKSYDGYCSNVKFVDRCSGFIFTGWLSDLKSSSILELFRIFKEQVEKGTESSIKIVRTDGGTEFTSVFENYLISCGIIKETAQAYRKHMPPRAERAHQTILHLGKAALLDSKLPISYYSDAHRYSTYVCNRMTRAGKDKSPYEILYKKVPDLMKIFAFGCICYVHTPIERRKNLKKLDATGVKCRFLGFGDEAGSQIIHGYKVLRESDFKVFYSTDVQFYPDLPMTPLSGLPLTHHDDSQYKELWNSIFQNRFSNNDDDDDDDEVVVTKINNNDEVIVTKGSIAEEKLDNAIALGHIDTTRGYDIAPTQDPFVLLARETDLSIQSISQPEFYKCFSAAMSMDCPVTYEEAIAGKDSKQWRDAMDKEMQSIEEAETYEIKTPTNLSKAPVKCRWVFSKKYDKFGNVSRYKARLVAKGYTQKFGFDYFETFSPVLKFTSLRVLIAIAAHFKLDIYQDDVPTAFLKGVLKEEIWMEQPPGFEKGLSNELCYLKKTLYGLKQSPREWNHVIHDYLLSLKFTQSKADPCVYAKQSPLIIIGVYVDDIATVGKESDVLHFRKQLRKEFGITQGGPLDWYLGISIQKFSDDRITLDQMVYLKQKLEEFKDYIPQGGISSPLPQNYQRILQDAEGEELYKGSFPYRKIVGSIMYAMLGTRPDLACAISVVSQFLDRPKPVHVKLVQRILQYIKVNQDMKLIYGSGNDVFNVVGYCDASYANETQYHSRSGFGFMLGGSLISWYSKKQSVPAQSSAEAEYYAASRAANEAIWLKKLLNELGFEQKTVTIYEDNQACIALTKNPEDHKRTKHIQVKYHVIRYYVSQGLVKMVYCHTKDQLADIFTKGVPGHMLKTSLKNLGMSRI
ncbi:MAG: hypothetical protein RL713_854, partial [Bacteroidota bacterium]